MFILGLLSGLLVALLILVIEIYLKPRNKGLPQLIRMVDEQTRPKGAIFFPRPDAVRSAEEKIKQNDQAGKDTNIDEIL